VYVIWTLGIVVVAALLVQGVGFAITQVDMFLVRHSEARMTRVQHNVSRDLAADEAHHRRAMMEAERKKALREAEVISIVANGQVYLSDANPHARWKHMHQMPHYESNGHYRPPTPQELETFRLLNTRSAAALPGQTGEMQKTDASFPELMPLLNLLPPEGASLEKLIFGLTVNEQGEKRVLKAPVHNLVHVAVGGETGWGKSVFLLAFMFQVAYAREEAEIVLIDPQDVTFSALAGAQKLRYRVGVTDKDIAGIMDDLNGEFDRRTALFKKIPQATKLTIYNRFTTEPLPPIVVGIDEITTVAEMLKGNRLKMPFKLLIQRCRKYGIYFVSGAPSWRSSDLETTLRSQFSTTVHFHARDGASSRILLGRSDAKDLNKRGHAYAILPGRPMTRILAPYIDYEQIMRYLSPPQKPAAQPVAPPPPPSESEAQDREFVRLVSEGKSRRQAARQAYGQDYAGTVVKRGKAALGETD